MRWRRALGVFVLLAACEGGGRLDGGVALRDGGASDGAALDAEVADASAGDAGEVARDAGSASDDGGGLDGSVLADGGGAPVRDGSVPDDGGDLDASSLDDAGRDDAGLADAGFDASVPDAGFDASVPDAGFDAGTTTVSCLSGATGTHVVRFRWAGTSSGSTAYVQYEANTLPDTTRWRVTAASSAIGYRPVFSDPFLGEGGLELSGTAFIDVELSTSGLGRVERATLAIYGRSFNTTASGSFSWQTFSGTGATPSGFVSNVAPYRWYGADATAPLPAGDERTLLRIRPGPPSGALIVARVEICFDAR
ncbi:MAG: hypothetical protein KF729_10805 [Sandaracinaceae bacterium]|nr:hypothetical protein [Sandaracinaceae bacterium]